MHTGHNALVALENANVGIPVFPCLAAGPRAKRPLVPGGFKAAANDLLQIGAWWRRWPDALVGIPTGPQSGLWVLDVDGDVGRKSLNKLLALLGFEALSDLTRVVSRTPSGGLHLFFGFQAGECPRTRASDIGPGLDTRGVKADGTASGYYIAPGSRLPDGRRYELIDPIALCDLGVPL
jgi:Bifunctional DNA primase/polymerase, N-terminal